MTRAGLAEDTLGFLSLIRSESDQGEETPINERELPERRLLGFAFLTGGGRTTDEVTAIRPASAQRLLLAISGPIWSAWLATEFGSWSGYEKLLVRIKNRQVHKDIKRRSKIYVQDKFDAAFVWSHVGDVYVGIAKIEIRFVFNSCNASTDSCFGRRHNDDTLTRNRRGYAPIKILAYPPVLSSI